MILMDYVILAAVLALIIGAALRLASRKKTIGCGGCIGACAGCPGKTNSAP
jgi:hypothetical protein